MLGSVVSVLLPRVALLIVFLAAIWCWVQWKYREVIRVAATVPCVVPRWPIVGHLPYFVFPKRLLTRSIDTTGLVDLTMKAVSQGRDTVCFWLGPFPYLMLHSLDDIKKVLNSSNTLEKSDEYKLIDKYAGNGLVTGPVSVWKHTRRQHSPLFQPQNMEAMVLTFNSNSRQFVALLEGGRGDGAVEVYDHAMVITLKTICQLIFGATAEFDVTTPFFSDIKHVSEKVPDLFMKRIMQPWLQWQWLFDFLFKKDMREIDSIIERSIREAFKNSKAKENPDGLLQEENIHPGNEIANNRFLCLLDTFEDLKKKYPYFNDTYFKEELITFIGAGSDTLGVAVSSCLLMVAKYQDVQERLFLEIQEVVGLDNDVCTQDLRKMPYLNQVYKETLRWAMVVPFIGRKTTSEVKLTSCTVPAGCSLVISIAGVNMDPKRYPNPEKFNPENFSPDRENGTEKYSFLPFSGGPRNCIGQLYAEILFKLLVIHVLRAYKLSTDMDVDHLVRHRTMFFISAEGYKVHLTPRP